LPHQSSWPGSFVGCSWCQVLGLAVTAGAGPVPRRDRGAETGYAEIKTCLRGPGQALRGRTPALARQELWAYLAIYQALRTLIARDGLDPARISFTAALNAAQRTTGTDPAALPDAQTVSVGRGGGAAGAAPLPSYRPRYRPPARYPSPSSGRPL
jgi:hypothetical protein